jgi:hypothetical protein
MTVLMYAVRRALEHPATGDIVKRATTPDFQDELLSWGGACLFITVILFAVILNAVS